MGGADKVLLIIRPELRAGEDAAFFGERGINAHIAPVLAYEDVAFEMPKADQVDVLMITSAQAMARIQGADTLKNKPLYCVGAQSAKAAKDAGFTRVRHANGTAKEMLDMVKAQVKPRARILYLRGEDVSVDLSQSLGSAGFSCESRIVYRAAPRDIFDEKLRTLIQGHTIAAVSFYSQRSARIFAEGVKAYGLEGALCVTKALCISRPVVECVRVLPWADVLLAERPDGDAMRALSLKAMGVKI